MKKCLLKPTLSFALTVVLIFTAVFALPCNSFAAAEDREYVPVYEIIDVGANSVLSDGYGPDKAFNGDITDASGCWHTAMDGSFPYWIMAEFDEPKLIDALVCYARNTNAYVTDYEVWVSPDSDEANLIKISEDRWDISDAVGNEFTAEFGSAVDAKLVKFVINSEIGAEENGTKHVSLNEIKFRFDESAEAPNYVPNGIITAAADSEAWGGVPGNAFDGIENDVNNFWHSAEESASADGFEHWITAEFDEPQIIDAMIYYARPVAYHISDYVILVSADGDDANWTEVARGTWERKISTNTKFTAAFDPAKAKKVKFVIKGRNDGDTSSVAVSELKFRIGEIAAAPELISVAASDGVAVASDTADRYNITWNAKVDLIEPVTLEEINASATFKEYGVYYGVSESDVMAIAGGDESVTLAKKKAFNSGDDIDVYTIFGFRLKNVAKGRIRAAMFYITYELEGKSYTVYSDCITAAAE